MVKAICWHLLDLNHLIRLGWVVGLHQLQGHKGKPKGMLVADKGWLDET